MDKRKLVRWLIPLALIVVGAVAGYLYYAKVGCVTGSCAITSNPVVSTAYGAIMGALLGVIAMPGKKKETGAENKN